MIVLGGRSEFIEKYFEVIGDLHARGFAAASLDWRGQGLSARMLSERRLGHIDDFSVYRADLDHFIETHVRPRSPGPYYLVAHSMGGVPTLQLLADGDDRFAAALFSAPMTRLFSHPVKRIGVRALAGAASRLGAARRPVPGVREFSLAFEGNVLTSDRKRHARFRELQEVAPEATIREPTFGWLKAAMAAMDDLRAPGRFDGLRTPILIVSAGADELVRASDHPVIAARNNLIACRTIDGALHEILMERDAVRDQWWAAADAFLADHASTRQDRPATASSDAGPDAGPDDASNGSINGLAGGARIDAPPATA